MDTNQPELTIVVPVFNEAEHLAESLVTIAASAASICSHYELVVIDDGSADDTWDVLEKSSAYVKGLIALRLSRNFGKESALCAGLEYARGKAIIVMDGDLQHPPQLIPEMVRLWREEHYEVVECVKTSRGRESWNKRAGASLFYGTLNQLSGFDLKNASDFKLLDQKVIEAWRQMPERTMFFRGMSAWLGYRRTKLPFEVQSRSGGDSRWSIRALARLALDAIVSFSTKPLRIVTYIGLLFFVCSVILGIHTLVNKLQGDAVTGFTTVILLQLIIGSVLMVSIGVVGEYIGAIYHEVKGRPRYLISARSQHTSASIRYEENNHVDSIYPAVSNH
ncbi:glycosyltransferase family 2 protein [Paenibacillus sp. SYP-B4298]|uniref:glycosyltransferase family 2 protein n=1 Tax=Paenibacillus sp. SYP-B4298 TaxID=2996034 RepID=UPI0022DDAE4F|nr:glycosyltransferase family 2 protein [Paenibacillus sp. SYP-B4298]